jgi:hypothetical protein
VPVNACMHACMARYQLPLISSGKDPFMACVNTV